MQVPEMSGMRCDLRFALAFEFLLISTGFVRLLLRIALHSAQYPLVLGYCDAVNDAGTCNMGISSA